MSVIFKRGSSFLFAFIYVYFIYSLCTILLKIGFEGASRDIFFFTLSIYLCVPIVKYSKMKGTIMSNSIVENYRINREAGKLKDNANIMEGLILKGEETDFKIENIVVTNRGVFNIAKCNYMGDIEIRDDNRWYRVSRKDSSEVISPIVEIRNNRKYLSKILDEELIIDLIVIVNNSAFIEGDEKSDVPIIRYDELYDYINEYPVEEELDSDKIYDKIYKRMIKLRDITEEKKLYNNFMDNIWTFRSRLMFISIFFIVYILNIAYMQRG